MYAIQPTIEIISLNTKRIESIESYIIAEWSGLERDSQSMVEHIYRIGEKLIEAEAVIPRGEYGHWVETRFAEIGMSYETATNFKRIARRLSLDFIRRHPKLSTSVLYILARKSTPESAVQEIASASQNGKMTVDEANRINRATQYLEKYAPDYLKHKVEIHELATVDAADAAKAYTIASEAVKSVAVAYGIHDSRVIHLLGDIQRKEEDEFYSIAATGYIQDGERSIPIADANYRELTSYMEQVRREQNLVKYQETIVLDSSATILSIEGDTICLKLAQPAPETLRCLPEVRLVLRVRD